ncbi:polysaccharide pyruvyl transferase family protein [Micromonospora sp. NBC_01796]|uniref:polysaccharide pyruvyl transferase family protein n=1 Tax=Micromonospora sp. NBC_01796 TaxID=2975987 RepID=UPI002DD8EC40|nr:polysaccharide pyruvyl transferase family protein [Micromonospora sp. NBC_01796]WSA85053.1 polysaccharide pyruvyl transferase family protein [Micromonospora sp. NBC_01796]
MRIGIAGWFGSDNLGDEILLHTLVSCVRSVDESASFVVFSPNPDRVAALHRVDAERMPTLRARGAVGRQGTAQRAIRDCDILFLGPGTVFQERSPNLPWPGTLPLFARIVGMARLARTPVAPVGVGVREGGTPAGRRLLRVIGAASVAIGVRDQRSGSYFGARAQVIGDVAYALPIPDTQPAAAVEEAAGSARPTFALSMRPLAPDTEAGLLLSIGGCLDRLQADGWTGDFLPMAFGQDAQGEDDRDIYRRAFGNVLGLAGNPLNDREGTTLAGALDGWLTALAGYRLVIGTRLHAAVMAVALGVPTVAIAYERKVHDAFVDLGLGRFVVGPDVDAETLHRTATAAAGSPAEFREAAGRVARQGRIAREFVTATLKGLG